MRKSDGGHKKNVNVVDGPRVHICDREPWEVPLAEYAPFKIY